MTCRCGGGPVHDRECPEWRQTMPRVHADPRRGTPVVIDDRVRLSRTIERANGMRAEKRLHTPGELVSESA